MGSHDRLVVDYTLLEESKRNLGHIHKVFEGIDDRSDALSDSWGHHSIAEKMDEFVSNWDSYREELVKNVEDLKNHVSGALKNFQQQDLDLKNATEKKAKDGGK